MIHETPDDKASEQSFANLLQSNGYTVHSLKQFYPCDFLIQSPKGYSLAEYKRRNHHSSTYKTAILPASKWANCRTLARELNLPFFIFLQYDDVLLCGDGLKLPYEITFTGRRDRGTDEREPMVSLFLGNFIPINLLPVCYQENMTNPYIGAKSLILKESGYGGMVDAPDSKSF